MQLLEAAFFRRRMGPTADVLIGDDGSKEKGWDQIWQILKLSKLHCYHAADIEALFELPDYSGALTWIYGGGRESLLLLLRVGYVSRMEISLTSVGVEIGKELIIK